MYIYICIYVYGIMWKQNPSQFNQIKSIYPSTYPSTYSCAYLSIHLSIHPSINLSIDLSIYLPFIHPIHPQICINNVWEFDQHK